MLNNFATNPLVKRKTAAPPDTRKPIGKCVNCKAPIKTQIKGRMWCFDCYNKDTLAGITHYTSVCLFHRKTYVLAIGCEQCKLKA